MLIFTEEIGHNWRNAATLEAPSRPSPLHAVRSGATMAKPHHNVGRIHPRRGTTKRYIVSGDRQGGDVYEHRAVAARALGKPLPDGAEVHHVDGDKKNNAPSNLVICQDCSYHRLLHSRARIVAFGGNPNTDAMCSACKKPRPLTEFYVRKTTIPGRAKAGTVVTVCKACVRLRWRKATDWGRGGLPNTPNKAVHDSFGGPIPSLPLAPIPTEVI